jgi:hypothetical protein
VLHVRRPPEFVCGLSPEAFAHGQLAAVASADPDNGLSGVALHDAQVTGIPSQHGNAKSKPFPVKPRLSELTANAGFCQLLRRDWFAGMQRPGQSHSLQRHSTFNGVPHQNCQQLPSLNRHVAHIDALSLKMMLFAYARTLKVCAPSGAIAGNQCGGLGSTLSVPKSRSVCSFGLDLELQELQHIACSLQQLLRLDATPFGNDGSANAAGVAAAQSLLLLLQSLARIPITCQLLIHSQIAVPVRACCQVPPPLTS